MNFKEKYAALAQKEKDVLLTMVLYPGSLVRTAHFNMLTDVGAGVSRGEIPKILKILHEKGFLERLSSNKYIVLPQLVGPAYLESQLAGYPKKLSLSDQFFQPYEAADYVFAYFLLIARDDRDGFRRLVQRMSSWQQSGFEELRSEMSDLLFLSETGIRLITTFSNTFAQQLLSSIVYNSLINLYNISELTEMAVERKWDDAAFYLKSLTAHHELKPEIASLVPEVLFWQGKPAEALVLFEKDLREFRKDEGKNAVFPFIRFMPYAFSKILGQPLDKLIKGSKAFLKTVEKYPHEIRNMVLALFHWRCADELTALQHFEVVRPAYDSPAFFRFWHYTLSRLLNHKKPAFEEIEPLFALCAAGNYWHFAKSLADTAGKFYPDRAEKMQKKAEKKHPYPDIFTELKSESKWEKQLAALTAIGRPTKGNRTVASERRLVWLLDFEEQGVQPKEQVFGKNGKWSKGKNVALKRLKAAEVECMTDQDRPVLKAVLAYDEYNGWGTATTYQIEWDIACRELVGHSLVFDERTGVQVELIKEEIALKLEEKDEQLFLSLSDDCPEQPGITIRKETGQRYKVLDVSQRHIEAARILAKGLEIPKEGRAELEKTVAALGKIFNLRSDLVLTDKEIKSVVPDNKPTLLLLPLAEGFRAEMYAKPFKDFPPYFKPGQGGKVAFAEQSGLKMQAERDFSEEIAQAAAAVEACASLRAEESEDHEWLIDNPEDCLQLLDELRAAGEFMNVEWPEGEKLRLAGSVSFNSLLIKVKSGTDWFGVSAELQVSENQVIGMEELLRLTEEAKGSRFLRLDNGEFLALSKQLRRQIARLADYAEAMNAEGELKLNRFSASALADLEEQGAVFQADKKWSARLGDLEKAVKLKPRLPQNLLADLRPYQEEGYCWARRLAEIGAGACLADDMGLGKTIQALGLILSRSAKGPTLVAAPASVTRNWAAEAQKFAPSLNVKILGVGDRENMINSLKSNDLLICGYSLLHYESELLSRPEFATVIFDEAQALKNPGAKRSRAAYKIKAGFRMILTGTPIENRLSELWSLFNQINPGLLGSQQRFTERFSLPIETGADDAPELRERLRSLIRPYILRRKKHEVLDDLPEKTEIILSAQPSDAERAFYESLRRQAVSELDDNDSAEGRHIRILAQITKLRLAGCHPVLVNPSLNLPSAKFDLFFETMDELLSNGHKVLVFSQFVKHLAIIRAESERRNISYLYLDGSTPTKNRQPLVNRFQSGEADVFFISLKAGGTGLNLTAADYVIHLDPWWNPAVEDQASDRAHRIGQRRPVTVYRIISEGTIEEKIVGLHHKKRDLADGLLEGTDLSGKISAEDLLNLIREN